MPNNEMTKVATKEKCGRDCEGFTGELFSSHNSKDFYICRVSGYVGKPFWMPYPHLVGIGDECKFKGTG